MTTNETIIRVMPSEITMSINDSIPHTKNWSFSGWSGIITRQDDWSSKIIWDSSDCPDNRDYIEDAVRYQNNVG